MGRAQVNDHFSGDQGIVKQRSGESTPEALAAEVQRLQALLHELLTCSEDNQRIQQRFRDFEYQLLHATTFQELLDTLLVRAKQHFKLAAVSFVALDEDDRLAELIDEAGTGYYDQCLQLRRHLGFFSGLYAREPKVTLMPMDRLTSARLFPSSGNVASAALLPLVRQQRVIGSWHFGSADPKRYIDSKATDFLEHLALLAAICFENAVALEHIQHQGLLDMLTQVKNRRCFEEEYPKELERALRNGHALTCLFIDVDHFKQVNDQYGHAAGDTCLKVVAREVQKQLRKTDLLVRFGGEEFVVLMPRCNEAQAAHIAERIRATIESLAITVAAGKCLNITVSLGASTWIPQKNMRLDEQERSQLGDDLLKQADQAMYGAKQRGRNRVEQITL